MRLHERTGNRLGERAMREVEILRAASRAADREVGADRDARAGGQSVDDPRNKILARHGVALLDGDAALDLGRLHHGDERVDGVVVRVGGLERFANRGRVCHCVAHLSSVCVSGAYRLHLTAWPLLFLFPRIVNQTETFQNPIGKLGEIGNQNLPLRRLFGVFVFFRRPPLAFAELSCEPPLFGSLVLFGPSHHPFLSTYQLAGNRSVTRFDPLEPFPARIVKDQKSNREADLAIPSGETQSCLSRFSPEKGINRHRLLSH